MQDNTNGYSLSVSAMTASLWQVSCPKIWNTNGLLRASSSVIVCKLLQVRILDENSDF